MRIKKRLTAFFTTFVIIISLFPAIPVSAAGGSCGDNLTWEFNNGVLTISGMGDMYDWRDGDAPWNNYHNDIISVVINDGVTSIGEYSFFCVDLKSIKIPEGVTKIGANAFDNCTELEDIKIPDSVTSIGKSAFNLYTKLKSINIPEGVTTIEYGTFFGCYCLVNIEFPTTLTTIESGAFSRCSLKSAYIPANLTNLNVSDVFADCNMDSIDVSPDHINYTSKT